MVIVALTDLHGIDRYLGDIETELKTADLVIVAGDITDFGGRREAAPLLDRLRALNERLVAVSGNCDYPEVDELLDESGINLDGRSHELGGLWLAGLGGSLPGPGHTPNTRSDDELGELLARAGEGVGHPFILVSHQPPFGTVADRAQRVRHVGSRSVRRFIEERAPIVCVCGHIHESSGIDQIGPTKVINAGPFREGRWARIVVSPAARVDVELMSP